MNVAVKWCKNQSKTSCYIFNSGPEIITSRLIFLNLNFDMLCRYNLHYMLMHRNLYYYKIRPLYQSQQAEAVPTMMLTPSVFSRVIPSSPGAVHFDNRARVIPGTSCTIAFRASASITEVMSILVEDKFTCRGKPLCWQVDS